MKQDFIGKTVLVTGAGWGIGAAAAMLYATCGANVVVTDSSRKWGRAAVARIKSQKGVATYIKGDVKDAASCSKLIRRTIETYGSIDIACNNSAIFSESPDRNEEDLETFDHELTLDLQGLRNCMFYEIEAMAKQGGGIIINTSSVMGPMRPIGSASLMRYINTKYGMVALLQNDPGRDPPRGIHIHTLAPTFIRTTPFNDIMQPRRESGAKISPAERPALDQGAAGLILWLSSGDKQ